VQLPASADNVALPAFSRRMPRWLLCAVLRRPCCGALWPLLSIDISCPQQQTRGVRRPDGTDGQTDRQTDGRPTDT